MREIPAVRETSTFHTAHNFLDEIYRARLKMIINEVKTFGAFFLSREACDLRWINQKTFSGDFLSDAMFTKKLFLIFQQFS